MAAFLAEAGSNDLFAFYRLAAATGMRRLELLGLRWSDVDLKAGLVKVREVAVLDGYEVTFVADTKTESSRRDVPIGKGTVSVLREHRLATGAGSERVFEGVHPARVSKTFQTIRRRAGLTQLTFHGLRHSHACSLLRAGTPVHVVSARLGHSSPSVTWSIYAHALDSDARAAAVTGEDLLDTAAEEL